MTATVLNPRKALNKSFLKVKPQREDIERFKTNLIQLLDQINEKESEEFHKNIVSTFLNNTYYSSNHYINTKARNDLVIHNGKDAKTTVGVIIEAKKPANKSEMVQKDELNAKAFQELVLYYLRERISHGNLEVRHLLITNIFEWYIFDVDIFEKAFAQNKNLVKQFQDFEEKRLAGKNTDFFYKEIAEPAIEELLVGNSKAGKEIEYTYFDVRDYDEILRNKDKKDDNKLISLFKLLSPEHLLKLPFKNDSNSLDKAFYAELLHIIGLTELKEGSKKLIDRKESGKRDTGSIIENAITQLHSLDKISRLEKPSAFGTTEKERYFNVGLELVITWINRILFLKLLEAQLLTYNKGDKSYSFLSIGKIKNFDDLNSLFFQVMARKTNERDAAINKVFGKVPYLNSSLFEPTELEHICLFISQLQPDKELPILSGTVLKDNNGKKRTGKLNTLEYLFAFLDAYDFSSEGSEEIQEENKTLINASVLGLIFEKINGYKDGSFFTPGFITMYMCRETLRRAVVQKFNDEKKWKCKTIDELYDKIEDKKEANQIINSLKICDPAVGSGHFLVSALNEIISIKSDLKILIDRHGKTLRDYHVEVSNDELAITDENGHLFEYNPKNKESQRVQEALFHEKQTLIENSLFGVDINTNSVKICRLRLWIELLKNAYYKADSDFTELETLPNIDINIKCGNSLISRYPLDVDLSHALKKSKITIKKYREVVQGYRHATNKEQKREMEQLIAKIKGDFKTEISNNDPKVKRLNSKRGERDNLLNQHQLFELSKEELNERNKQIDELSKEINKIEATVEEIKNNKIYENAFEWRFEFPEILDNKGSFTGFDVVLGNPPYIQLSKTTYITGEYKRHLLERYKTSGGRLNTFIFFTHLSGDILKGNGILCFIMPNTILTQEYYSFTRKFLVTDVSLIQIVGFPILPFEDAVVETVIIQYQKKVKEDYIISVGELTKEKYSKIASGKAESIKNDKNYSLSFNEDSIVQKAFYFKHEPLGDICDINQAIALKGNKSLSLKKNNPNGKYYKLLDGRNINKYKIDWDGTYLDYDLDRIHSCKRKDIFESKEKLFFRRVSSSLIFAYDSEQYFALNTLVVLNHKQGKDNYDLKFLLALLNSKFMDYVYRNKFKSTKTVFSEIQARSVGQLPIPILSSSEQAKFIALSNEALKAKKKNKNADISTIEHKIDALVYKLFDLTGDEVNLI